MEISGFNPTTGTVVQTEPKSSANVDYDTFLQLLVTQMRNQDPTKPMDSTEYVAQLATFSNVEQSIQTNEKLDKLLNSSFLFNAASLIGKTISSADGAVSGQVKEVKVSGETGIAVLSSGDQIAVNGQIVISE
ncbi:MAG: flagellar hook assembly protein FlgD [Rhizobiaceae bacterium]